MNDTAEVTSFVCKAQGVCGVGFGRLQQYIRYDCHLVIGPNFGRRVFQSEQEVEYSPTKS